MYKCSDTVEQRVIPGGSDNKRLTDIYFPLTLCAWANLKLKISGWAKRCTTLASKCQNLVGSGGMRPRKVFKNFDVLRLLLVASETLLNLVTRPKIVTALVHVLRYYYYS